jgi:hypothetical protein
MSKSYLAAGSGQAYSLYNQKLDVDGLIKFAAELVGSLSSQWSLQITPPQRAEDRQLYVAYGAGFP